MLAASVALIARRIAEGWLPHQLDHFFVLAAIAAWVTGGAWLWLALGVSRGRQVEVRAVAWGAVAMLVVAATSTAYWIDFRADRRFCQVEVERGATTVVEEQPCPEYLPATGR